jgi:integrase
MPVQQRACQASNIEISLRTKSLHCARSIAAEVTRSSEHLLQEMRQVMISAEDARRILTKVVISCSSKLDSVVAAEIAYGESVANGRTMDIVVGWTYRLFAAQGITAQVGEIERQEMMAAGLDGETIIMIARAVATFRERGPIPPNRNRIAGLLKEFNIPETKVNMQQAEQLYLRGMAAALLNPSRRWTGLRDDDVLLAQTALLEAARNPVAQSLPFDDGGASIAQVPAAQIDVPVQVRPETPAPVVVPETAPVFAEVEVDDEVTDLDHIDDIEDESSQSLVDIVTAAGNAKVTLGEWESKTLKQHVQLAKLFERFLGHCNPTRVGQNHLAQFRDVLLKFPKNYGKSPRDHIIPVKEILARAEKLPKDQVGLSRATINRHMNNMANIAGMCKAYGHSWESYDGISKLRAKRRGNSENGRPAFTTGDIEALFSLPIWTGAAADGVDANAGGEIVHDARYWVPLIGAYQGARREEICGFQIDEIIEFEGIWGFKFVPTEVRRLKSEASKRHIPIHPELIRLGFLDYVAALKQAKHTLLFPELVAVAEATPMGDVFNDDWQKMKEAALPQAKEQRKVFHSFRHWCNNEMKQAGVGSEIRKDILGHLNDDVNEGTYSQVARLRLMEAALAKLPTPTSGIQPAKIRLLLQVVSHTPRKTRKKTST